MIIIEIVDDIFLNQKIFENVNKYLNSAFKPEFIFNFANLVIQFFI